MNCLVKGKAVQDTDGLGDDDAEDVIEDDDNLGDDDNTVKDDGLGDGATSEDEALGEGENVEDKDDLGDDDAEDVTEDDDNLGDVDVTDHLQSAVHPEESKSHSNYHWH